MKNVNVYNVNVLNDYDVDNETTEYVNVMKTLVQTVQNARHELTYLNIIDEKNDETLTFVLYSTGEQQDNEDVIAFCHIDDEEDVEYTVTWLYHWIATFVAPNYGFDDEEFEQFLEE